MGFLYEGSAQDVRVFFEAMYRAGALYSSELICLQNNNVQQTFKAMGDIGRYKLGGGQSGAQNGGNRKVQ